MRCDWCHKLNTFLAQWGAQNPGSEEEEEWPIATSMATTASSIVGATTTEFRRCQNIKSQKNPDAQCPFSAIHGDYCSRHFKKPRPWRQPSPHISPKRGHDDVPRIYTRAEHAALRRIQRFWRTAFPLRRFRSQGPAANDRSLSMNEMELYTMDPLSTIPNPYFISIADSRRCIWSFDIRSLVPTMASGSPIQNPYNREEFSAAAADRVHSRIGWLRRRKYHILFVNTDVLTDAQIWNQRVLDAFLKIEALGYYANSEWFHELTTYQLAAFYSRLYNLWEWRLGLSTAEREAIVPGHMGAGAQRLFRFPPGEHMDKGREWWARTMMAVIDAFLTRSADKEQQKLGAMYVLMGLVQVSRPAAQALPWVTETVFS